MTKTFSQFCNRYFGFLVDKFGCRVIGKTSDSFGDELTYQNSTTAVNIRYEPGERYVFVLLSRLIDGKIPDYPVFINRNTKLNQFYLDDLLTLRSPGARIQRKPFGDAAPDLNVKQLIKAYAAEPFTSQDLEHMIKTYAAGLRQHGADILQGDFTIFSELEKFVKKRAAENQRRFIS